MRSVDSDDILPRTMTFDEFNSFCGGLPAATHVLQWGGSDVWKVGGKLFAVGARGGETPAITFKVSEVGFEVLSAMPGLRPAPYLASRGMLWIQHHGAPGLSDDELRAHIQASYDMAIDRMTKKARAELGLI